ncbi:ribonuclease H-like domain-containing protein [Tanacetum coccineum]
MNQFCGMKGIKREFSVARTPQQNEVAERKNRTLTEETRTMLADHYYLLHFRLKQLVLLVIPQSSKDAVADDAGKKTNEDPVKEDDKSDKDVNGNSIYRMFTLVNAVRSSCDNLNGSIPVNAATLPNDNLPTDPFMPDLEDTAKACTLAKAQASEASSKAKVEACGSKAKVEACGSKIKLQSSTKTLIVKIPLPITNCVLRLANAKTWDAIKGKTFKVKIPPTMTCVEEKIGKRNLRSGKHRAVGFSLLADLWVIGFSLLADLWVIVLSLFLELAGLGVSLLAELANLGVCLLAELAVRIKSLLDAVRITAAHVCVNAAQLDLVLLVSNDDAAVAQRRLEDKQLEEQTNTDCLVKKQEKVHLSKKVGENIMVTGVPSQEGAEGGPQFEVLALGEDAEYRLCLSVTPKVKIVVY